VTELLLKRTLTRRVARPTLVPVGAPPWLHAEVGVLGRSNGPARVEANQRDFSSVQDVHWTVEETPPESVATGSMGVCDPRAQLIGRGLLGERVCESQQNELTSYFTAPAAMPRMM
jgi:hypothetical protein